MMDAIPGLDKAYSKEVKVWDAPAGNNVSRYDGHEKSVTAVAWSPDDKYIASASRDTTVHVWDLSSRIERKLLIDPGHTDRVNTVAWLPDGDLIASAGDDRIVRIWNPNTPDRGKDIYIHRGHTNHINTLSWSPDSTRIASAGDDGAIRIWPAS